MKETKENLLNGFIIVSSNPRDYCYYLSCLADNVFTYEGQLVYREVISHLTDEEINLLIEEKEKEVLGSVPKQLIFKTICLLLNYKKQKQRL